MLNVKKVLSKLIYKKETQLTGSYIQDNWKISRVGRTVYLQVHFFSSIPAGSFSLGAIVPEEFRPKATKDFTLFRRSSTFMPMAFSVNDAGVINCYNYASAQSSGNQFTQLLSWTID